MDILERVENTNSLTSPHIMALLLKDVHTEIGTLRAQKATLEAMNDHGMYMLCHKKEHRWIFGPKNHTCPVCNLPTPSMPTINEWFKDWLANDDE